MGDNQRMRVNAALWVLIGLLLQGCGGGSGAQGQFTFGTPDAITKSAGPDGGPENSNRTGASAGAVAILSGGCGTVHDTGDFIAAVTSGGSARSYRVHVPNGYDAAKPTPLVMSFHGSSKTALEQEMYSGLVPIADRERLILVTPEGSGFPQAWQIAGLYDDASLDDVVAAREIVEATKKTLCIDAARVYAAGLSNGAEMASQVGCYLPEVFAAVAPVAGVVYQGCDGRPMPVISFHGTEDYNVPFQTVRPAMSAWANHNGCSNEQDIVPLTEHVSRESYRGCGGADVVLYVITGGGHTWPDAEDFAGGAGPTTHEINAATLIWQFFASHPKPTS